MRGFQMIWNCTVCSHLSLGTKGPESCPVCGVPRDQFEEWTDHEHIRGTLTEANLTEALASKAQSFAKLLAWSTLAALQGDTEAAALFRQRADEHIVQATSHLIRLGLVLDTKGNLREAQKESAENSRVVYPGYFSAAEDEGFTDSGHYFASVGQRELSHYDAFLELGERLYPDNP